MNQVRNQVIDEDFHGVFDENLFHDLVTDDIIDPCLSNHNPNMEGGRQGPGQHRPTTKNGGC